MNLPLKIKEIIGDMSFSIDTIGMSSSQVICFNDVFLKIEKQGEESDNEHLMMEWLKNKLPVPQIFCIEKEYDINYLLMSKITGKMSCSDDILQKPVRLVNILANGLRMLWDIDTTECPYDNSLDNKLRLAEFRVRNKLVDIENVEPETFGEDGFKNPEDLLQWLKSNKPIEELVFSHGDYCLPNIFIEDDKINGFIDLGRSGVADIYQDIALCYRSLKDNYSGAFGGKIYKDFDAKILFELLEIIPDWDKVKYYILLDELF